MPVSDLHTLSVYQMIDETSDEITTSVKMLLAISHAIEDVVIDQQLTGTFYAGFQRMSAFLPQQKRFARLAQACGEVLVFALPDVSPPEVQQVQYVNLPDDSPLVHEWFVIFEHPDFQVALLTEQLDWQGDDRSGTVQRNWDRLYEGLLIHNNALIGAVHEQLDGVLGRSYMPVQPTAAEGITQAYDHLGRSLISYLVAR